MRAALFDLDGVLIDTEPSYSKFWGAIGEAFGVSTPDFANVIKGTTLTQILDRYFPGPETQARVVERLQQYERTMDYQVFDGVCDCLERLRAAGMPCAIVTSSNLEKMDNLWRQHPRLRGYFDAVVTDEDVAHSKPDPEPYLVAARKLGVAPEDTYVFEDSFNGLLSGRRAGAVVVGLDTTNPRASLLDKADLVVSGLSEISPEVLNGLRRP